MQKVIGIDLGTTNSVVAFKTRDVEVLRNRENDELTRSCVALRNDEILVGRHAFNVLAVNPENTILSVKRLMGGSITDPMVQAMRDRKDYYRYGIVLLNGGTDDAVAVVMGGKQYTPEQISAEILKKLKADAEEKLGGAVTHAVITVPAYFTEKQKNATRLAANYAGLKVLRLLAEPTAAAIAYGVDNAKAGDLQTVVVYDFGGGTFDVSVLNIIDRECLEMGAGGDRWLGGDNIDQALQAYIFKQVEATYNIFSLQKLIDSQTPKKRNQILAKLRVESEEAKIRLSGTQSQSLLIEDLLEDDEGNSIDIDLTITRAQLEQLIRPMVERTVTLTEELLVQLGYTPDMISAFLLVGGSSCIPLVKQLMAERFGADRVKVDKNPMLAVAKGAAMVAQSMGDTYECPNCGAAVPQTATKCPNCGYDVATEVKERGVGEVTLTAKHDLYVMVTDRNSNQERPERLFEKQTPLPASTSRVFSTAGNQQRLMKVEITSDVEDGQLERQTMGYSTVDGNLPAGSEFVFDFALSADEILSCKMYPKGFSNKAKNIVLGRGQHDSEALQKVDQLIQEFNTGGYSGLKSTEFAEALAGHLQLADNIGTDSAMDKRWAEVKYKAGESFDRATGEAEGDEDISVFIAQLLCDTYPQLLGAAEVNQLRGLTAQAKRGGFEGIQARQQISEINADYGVLLQLLIIKFAAREASEQGSSDGSRLRELHDRAVASFEVGDRAEAFDAINEAEPLSSKYMKGGLGEVVTGIRS